MKYLGDIGVKGQSPNITYFYSVFGESSTIPSSASALAGQPALQPMSGQTASCLYPMCARNLPKLTQTSWIFDLISHGMSLAGTNTSSK